MSHKHVILNQLSFAGISSASAQQTAPVMLPRSSTFPTAQLPSPHQLSALQCSVSAEYGIHPTHCSAHCFNYPLGWERGEKNQILYCEPGLSLDSPCERRCAGLPARRWGGHVPVPGLLLAMAQPSCVSKSHVLVVHAGAFCVPA